ncbi:MAG: hypothetical protein IJV24_03965 [Prevotella sp.]|nr:hypothetical protein [Prevotella sp.]
MKKTLLHLIALLLPSLTAVAQQQMFICHQDSCEAFEMRHVGNINFADGFLFIEHMQPYSVSAIDSIVFAHPALTVSPRGWWGNLDEGTSRCEARISDATLGFDYHVCFLFSAVGGICTQAACEVTFETESQKETFLENYFEEAVNGDCEDSPYIYVKETLTGPRKFELWTMSAPMLPMDACVYPGYYAPEDPLILSVELNKQLVGRSMTDVRQIIEVWLYTPAVQTENPSYKPNN